MRTLKDIKYAALAAIMAVGMPIISFAQGGDYNDDDLYFSPSKAAEKEKKNAAKKAEQAKKYARRQASTGYVNTPDRTYESYLPADSYSDVAVSNRPLQVDVDEYNRGGQFLVASSDSLYSDSTLMTDGDFTYTNRIERFYNPGIVSESDDDDLKEYYYSTQAAQQQPVDVNVYVVGGINPLGYYGDWAWRYGMPSYMWGYYSPYYYGWGYDPFWDFSWGWGYGNWYWNHHYPWYGHHHHHHDYWYPSYSGSGHHWRPTGSVGAGRPHRPTYAGAGSTSGRRPNSNYNGRGSSTSSRDFTRPGNSGRRQNGTIVNRPSNGSTQGTPSRGSSSSSRRGRGMSSYNSHSSSSGSSSSSFRSSGGGRSGGGSFGGGSSRGGGSGSRGRR